MENPSLSDLSSPKNLILFQEVFPTSVFQHGFHLLSIGFKGLKKVRERGMSSRNGVFFVFVSRFLAFFDCLMNSLIFLPLLTEASFMTTLPYPGWADMAVLLALM